MFILNIFKKKELDTIQKQQTIIEQQQKTIEKLLSEKSQLEKCISKPNNCKKNASKLDRIDNPHIQPVEDIIDGVTLDKENRDFYHAIESVKNGTPLIYLTGKAGTGKSTFLKYLKKIENKNIIVLAPTGVAAMNVGGQTIHSFFRLPLSVFIPNDKRFRDSAPSDDEDQSTIYNYFPYNREQIRIIKHIDILVIDEVSMVRCDILDAIDRILRHFRKTDLPFGGIQTILIGDAFQLAPIASDDEWIILKEYYDNPYFFCSKIFSDTSIEYIELKKIYRQKDRAFINLLNNIRIGNITRSDVELLNSKYTPDFKPQTGDEFIILTTHNQFVREYNTNKLNELPEEAKCYNAEIVGNFPEKLMPTEKQLFLKVGAQVMFVKNDKGESRQYYNGKIGTIKHLTDNIITVICSNGEEINVSPDKWENKRYSWNRDKHSISQDNCGWFIQFPLKLAWAITVHKSQGLEFERVIADLSESFAPGQIYVALSRCTSFDGLKLISKIPMEAIHADNNVICFERDKCKFTQEETPDVIIKK